MGIIASRAVRTSQPQYPATIESSHPALDGVTASIITYGPRNLWRRHQGQGIDQPIFNGVIAAGPTPIGAGIRLDGSTNYLDYGTNNIPADEFTLFVGGVFDALSGVTGVADCSNGSTSGWSLFTSGTDMYLSGNHYSGDLASSGWVTGKVFHLAARNKSGVGKAIFRNGAKIATSGLSLVGVSNPVNPLWIGRLRVSGPQYVSGRFAYCYLINKYLDDATIIAIQANAWQLLAAEEELILVSSGGSGVSLSSSAAANVTGSGALSVAVPVAGASAAIATGQGTLGIDLPLAGTGTSVVTGAATLNATQALSGSGIAGASGQGTLGIAQTISGSGAASVGGAGTLSLAIQLNSAALTNAIGSGTLNGSVAIAGAGAADVSGQGTISIALALSAAAIADAVGSANLGVNGALQGAAVASVSGHGTLNQAIPLQGASLTATNASGTLTQIVPVSANAVSLVSGQASLVMNVSMKSDALVEALAVGNLTLRIALSAAAIANVVASASFPHLPTPAWRTCNIQDENRTWCIQRDDRILRMSA